MKKFLISMFLIFCLADISYAKTYNIKGANDNIELKKSDVIIFELSENPSTGFSWEFVSTDENVAQIVDKRLVYPPRPKNQPPLCGQGGTAIYKVKAINSGNAQIKGTYRRPWENNPPISEYSLNIKVK